MIGDKGGKALAELVACLKNLEIFNVSWNKIRWGGISLAEGLKDNKTLKSVDLSWNSMGSKKNGEFGLKIGEAANAGTITHLDLSYNSMDKNECRIFGETIQDNHSLWGLHMIGNDCLVDP